MKLNWFAVLAAVIAQQLVGFVWYSPALFAGAWSRGIGKRPEDLQPAPGPFLLAVAAALLLALGIAWIIHKTHLRGVKAGALIGFGAGLFFAAPAVLVHEAFLGYPPLVLAIDATKELVGAILTGAIVAAWPRRNDALAPIP